MNTDQIVFILVELLALVLVIRLWIKPGRRTVARVVWSLVLLVPVAGILAYCFVAAFPKDLSEEAWFINEPDE
jgi:uncharacterized membrane protein